MRHYPVADSARAPRRASAPYPADLLKFGIIDDVITEPIGGAHRDHAVMGQQMRAFIRRYLAEICKVPVDRLVEERLARFRAIGKFTTERMPIDA